MKTQQTKLQRTKPSPANDRSSNQSVRNSQTPKNFQKRNCNSTPIDSNVETFTETCNRTTNLPLLQQNSRFTKQKRERTVKLRTNQLETAQTARNFGKTDRKLERTVENFKLPIKTQTNGGKLEFTEQSSNGRWKMVAPAHNHTETTETSRTHAVDGDRFYTAPRWAPDDPAG